MTKKLIDWATAPIGMKTGSNSTFLQYRNGIATVLYVFKDKRTSPHLAGIDTVHLRLAPSDQQPWLLYEEGVTIIPEWVDFQLKIKADGILHDRLTGCVVDGVISSNTVHRKNTAFAYKLGYIDPKTGVTKLFKDGWTDNPDEVTK